MKTLQLLTIVISIAITKAVFAQETGTIKGTITDEKNATIPFVAVVLMDNTTSVGNMNTDMNGDFTFKQLTPGIYQLKFSLLGYAPTQVKGVEVSANKTAYVYKKLNATSDTLRVIEVIEKWEKPIVDPTYSTVTSIPIDKITSIAASKSDPIAIIVALVPGVIPTDDGKDIYMRGSRRGSTAYYVDGNRIIGEPAVPGLGISGMEVLTGGVPAEYGDCTGGIVIITTKDYKTEMRRKRVKRTAQDEE